MKKAYVKPVFLAEEFECTAAVAGCVYSSKKPAQVWEGLTFCDDNGHVIGGQNGSNGEVNQWWDYATETDNSTDGPKNGELGSYNDFAYLFTSGSYECDFIWNSSKSDIYVWTKTEGDLKSAISKHTERKGAFATLVSTFVDFFYGIGSGACKMHEPEYLNEKIFS